MRIFHYSIAQFEIDFKLNLYFVIETIKKQTDSEAKKKKANSSNLPCDQHFH